MSTCHQAHNIPWAVLLESLELQKPLNPQSLTPRELELYWPRLQFKEDKEEKLPKKIGFFASKFESAIKEFAHTERKKIDDRDLSGETPRKIYTDDQVNEHLPAGKLQDLSYWLDQTKTEGGYCNSDFCLEVIKELFIQDDVRALLYMAKNGVEIERFQTVTYSNFFHYGIGRIKEDCLTLYIHLNILLANGIISSPEKWYGQWKQFLSQEILTLYDGNSNRRMYLSFFENNQKLEDLTGLDKLLKQLFRAVYVYDMVMRERGIEFNWKDEVTKCTDSYFYRRKGS